MFARFAFAVALLFIHIDDCVTTISNEQLALNGINGIRKKVQATNMNEVNLIAASSQSKAVQTALKTVADATCESNAGLAVAKDSAVKDFFFVQQRRGKPTGNLKPAHLIADAAVVAFEKYDSKAEKCKSTTSAADCSVIKAILTAGFSDMIVYTTSENKKCAGEVVVTYGFKPKTAYDASKAPYSKKLGCPKGRSLKDHLCSSGNAVKATGMSLLALCLIGFQLVTGGLLRN